VHARGMHNGRRQLTPRSTQTHPHLIRCQHGDGQTQQASW
jgi:hypothetical protein